MKFFENFSNYTFETKSFGKKTEIIVINNKIKIGSITFQTVYGDEGLYWFDGLLSDEQYDDLFEDKLFVIIENIKINPEYQKNGLGKELMNKALELISSKNIKLISLNASPLNNQINSDKLLLFYQKFGFKIFKKQGKNVIMIKKI